MNPHPYPPTKLELLLRDTCRRALRLDLTFADQLRLCRSIIALAREVRLRWRIGDLSLAALLATVCDRVCDLGLDPTLPLPDALLLQRVATGLSRAVRLAERRITAKNPVHRENASESPADKRTQHPVHREDRQNRNPAEASPPPADPAWPDTVRTQYPMHREDGPNADSAEASPPPADSALPDMVRAQYPMHVWTTPWMQALN